MENYFKEAIKTFYQVEMKNKQRLTNKFENQTTWGSLIVSCQCNQSGSDMCQC